MIISISPNGEWLKLPLIGSGLNYILLYVNCNIQEGHYLLFLAIIIETKS